MEILNTQESKILTQLKQGLITDLQKRVADRILEAENAKLLQKLILRAKDTQEALDIAALGTTYKHTGFHFDKRLEKGVIMFFISKKEAI